MIRFFAQPAQKATQIRPYPPVPEMCHNYEKQGWHLLKNEYYKNHPLKEQNWYVPEREEDDPYLTFTVLRAFNVFTEQYRTFRLTFWKDLEDYGPGNIIWNIWADEWRKEKCSSNPGNVSFVTYEGRPGRSDKVLHRCQILRGFIAAPARGELLQALAQACSSYLQQTFDNAGREPPTMWEKCSTRQEGRKTIYILRIHHVSLGEWDFLPAEYYETIQRLLSWSAAELRVEMFGEADTRSSKDMTD
jgi:hypothetical protein